MKKIVMMIGVVCMSLLAFAAQCQATTKKGTQCKRQASPGSQYCWQHGGTTKAQRAAGFTSPAAAPKENPAVAVAQCKATTKKGTRCSRQAKAGSEYCWQHGGNAVTGKAAVTPATEKPAEFSSEKTTEAVATGMCQATTKSGKPCSRKAKPGQKYCWQHLK